MLRRVLPLIAVAAVLGMAACGDEEGDEGGGGAQTQGGSAETTPEPGEAEDALKDTSVKPVIPKPTGSPPRRLVAEDIVKGRGRSAKPGDTVIVHYVGMNFSNGEEFDSSWSGGGPVAVELGAGAVIEGWDRGLVGIRTGGRRMLTIPPEMGYGAEGYPPDIPPNETLIFVIDALKIG
jgi:peptidylprolyl isomerase